MASAGSALEKNAASPQFRNPAELNPAGVWLPTKGIRAREVDEVDADQRIARGRKVGDDAPGVAALTAQGFGS